MGFTPHAIETRYQGYRFRSRLEARWAVFFDTLGVKWVYELEGFEKEGERYLPDFFLPRSETWVEVKGSDEALQKDIPKLVTLLDWGSPLSGFNDSFNETRNKWPLCPGLLLLGDIPAVAYRWWGHTLIQHHKGLWVTQATFWEGGLYRSQEYGDYSTGWTIEPQKIEPSTYPELIEAYAAARGARFEFGERGR